MVIIQGNEMSAGFHYRGWILGNYGNCLGGFLLEGSNVEKWCDHQKNFFINNSKGFSMCHGLIETVKYIWVNISCMLDWILSQNCRNTLPLQTVDQLVLRNAKT